MLRGQNVVPFQKSMLGLESQRHRRKTQCGSIYQSLKRQQHFWKNYMKKQNDFPVLLGDIGMVEDDCTNVKSKV